MHCISQALANKADHRKTPKTINIFFISHNHIFKIPTKRHSIFAPYSRKR